MIENRYGIHKNRFYSLKSQLSGEAVNVPSALSAAPTETLHFNATGYFGMEDTFWKRRMQNSHLRKKSMVVPARRSCFKTSRDQAKLSSPFSGLG